jgi:cell division protein FtsI/penicillin-binding protein 2
MTALALVPATRLGAVTRPTTTIDPSAQRAADDAAATSPFPVEIVAIRASSGDIIAYTARGSGVSRHDALAGRYPTGSTFKIVTATALLASGASPTTAATCPGSVEVGGTTFTTFAGAPDATVHTITDAFTHSCNTAFAVAGAKLTASDFTRAATRLGLGFRPRAGRGSFGGSVVKPRSEAERASLASDGGPTVVSPLALATVAATVDSGRPRVARLSLRTPTVRGARLAPAVVTGLRSMMAAVVSNGTASGQGLPPGTYAKTGTAVFEHAPPPRTVYAWLIGYRGDVAFAVLVVGGSQGGPAAGPVAARLLTELGERG